MGNSVKTIVVQSDDADAWDAYVHAHPEAEYGHLFQWSRVIEEVVPAQAVLPCGDRCRSRQRTWRRHPRHPAPLPLNKGIKNGLETRIGREELLEPLYSVFSRNMRDLGSPVHSKKFFQAIFKYFRQEAYICLVASGKRPVAASFMFRFRDELKNPWASSFRKFRHLNSNMLLYWAMIRFACDEGMHCFDMGRSSRGASTYRFKQQWGPEERPLFWYN